MLDRCLDKGGQRRLARCQMLRRGKNGGDVSIAFRVAAGYLDIASHVGPSPEPAVVAGPKVLHVARAPRPAQ